MKKDKYFTRKLDFIFVISIFLILSFTIILLLSVMMFLYRTGRIGLRSPLGLILFLVFMSIIIGTFFSRHVGKNFIKTIESISEASIEISKGNFDVVLKENHYIEELKTMSQNFNIMAHELRQIDAISQDFVNNISHEFKTPVSAIEGYATLLQNNKIPQEDLKLYTERIIFNTKRLTSLVNNILELSKLEHQDISIKKESFDMDEQIREVILSLEPNWSENDIHFNLELDPVSYYGSESLFYLVWENLIHNAIKFSYKQGNIDIALYKEDDKVYFKIKDEGIGIQKSIQDKIFKQFYQEETSHTTQGNGLGLSLVDRVISIHQGTIELKSDTNSGTEFTINLPINKGDF